MKADTIGGITPAVLVTLREKEKILAEHEIMLYKEPPVQLHRRTLKSLGVSTSHMIGMRGRGDNEEGHYFAEFEGPGHVCFSRDKGGEVRIHNLQPQETLRLLSDHLICFDETVRFYPMVLGQYNTTNDRGENETHYLFADELTGPGTIAFQSYGNLLSFNLKPGEPMRTSVLGLLAVSNTVSLSINWLMRGGRQVSASGGGSLVGGMLGGGLGGMLGSAIAQRAAGGGSAGAFQGSVQIPVVDLVGPGIVLVHSGA